MATSMNEFATALILGIVFRQIVGFQSALAEFSRNMAKADGKNCMPIAYQNMMTPRWLTALFLVTLGGFICLVVRHAFLGGWQDGFADILAFAGGTLASRGISVLARFPSTTTYVHSALRTLTNRETDYRSALDIENAEAAAHTAGFSQL
jgi:hypothetical protein